MTWVVELPEGSRPGKHEIKVPEGKVITDHQLVKFLEKKQIGIYPFIKVASFLFRESVSLAIGLILFTRWENSQNQKDI